MSQEQKKQQTIEWVVTLICLILGFYNHLALINNWPHLEIVDTEITKYVNWGYELVIGVYAFWINNNITSPAQLVQVLLNKIKQGLLSNEQMQLLLTIADLLISKSITTEQLKAFAQSCNDSSESIKKEVKEAVQHSEDLDGQV